MVGPKSVAISLTVDTLLAIDMNVMSKSTAFHPPVSGKHAVGFVREASRCGVVAALRELLDAAAIQNTLAGIFPYLQ